MTLRKPRSGERFGFIELAHAFGSLSEFRWPLYRPYTNGPCETCCRAVLHDSFEDQDVALHKLAYNISVSHKGLGVRRRRTCVRMDPATSRRTGTYSRLIQSKRASQRSISRVRLIIITSSEKMYFTHTHNVKM